MSLSDHDRALAAAFLVEAERFRAFVVQGASELDVKARTEALAELLVRLYATALALPAVEPDDQDVDDAETRTRIKRWPGLAVQYYWENFDPLEEPSGVQGVGDVDDDVLITNDLIDGIEAWHRGATVAALWHWHFSFETHWGDHLVDALRVVHRLLTKQRRE